MEVSLNLYQSMALAVGIYYLGWFIKKRVVFLQTYCIPIPVIGGIIYSIVALILHQTGTLELTIDTTLQSVFMNVFFTSIGYTASFSMIKKAGKSLVFFLVVVGLLICVQNIAGALLCNVFGLDPLLGVALGSMPLTGGHGTSAAFAPLLVDRGLSNALTVSVAAATYGLVAGVVMGNPLARRRIEKLHLSSRQAATIDKSVMKDVENAFEEAPLDADRGTLGLGLLFVATGIGTLISMLFDLFHVTFASYVGAMIVGIIIRNISDRNNVKIPAKEIETIGSISLNFFLVLAMMSMQLYQLADLAVPMVVILLVQTVITGLFVYFITFNLMGRDYDAAVLSTGHCGFGMGATPNAMVNMDALTKEYGPSDKAYLIIPICGGFFTDIVNSLLLTFFINIL